MSLAKLLVDGLRYHARVHAAVALAVAAATAVLAGALVVGDSVRGSLRHLALDRLGRIDSVLLGDRLFNADLAQRWAPALERDRLVALPAMMLEGSLERPEGVDRPDQPHPGQAQPGQPRPGQAQRRPPQPWHSARAGNVGIIGADPEFWSLGSGGPRTAPRAGEVAINGPLAGALDVAAGDEVILRIGKSSDIPAESALGRKTDATRSRRLTVCAIIPAEGLGRFALRPDQQLPLNAYVPIETVQAMLDQPGRANAVFIAAGKGLSASSPGPGVEPPGAMPPPPLTLDDYGLALRAADAGYWQLSSQRMLLEPATQRAANELFADEQPRATLTYLANTIADESAGGAEIPYSTITAIDFAAPPPQGPFTSPQGAALAALGDGEIALNTWAVEHLGAKLGDEIRVDYFKPESIHGRVERGSVHLRLAAIVAMTGRGADRQLTPELRGITDQKSIADWDPPFPFEPARVRKVDEEYWDRWRTAPKAYVSLATGRRLWSSRFGDATAIELNPAAGQSIDDLGKRLAARLDPASMGVRLLPVKRIALAAAQGTTPFNLLFLGFSMFLMVAAVLLVSLLFRLGVEQRCREIGLLKAVGFPARRIVRLMAGEGLLVAAAGAAIGAAAGLGYAWLMLAGLRTWWLAAVSTPFLRLYWTPQSLIVGFACGVLASMIAMLLGLRRLGRLSAWRLLSGQTETVAAAQGKRGSLARWIAVCSAALALAAGFAALRLGGEAQAGAFFGSGAAVLTAWIAVGWSRLKSGAARTALATGPFPLASLAGRNGARHPARSALAMGLVAAASFLIIAIGAFGLDPSSHSGRRDSGSGGFALLGQTSQPIFSDLNLPAAREEFGFSPADEAALAGATIFALRVQAGDDASCLNLYQPTQPRLLGVPHALVERGGFAWAGSLAESPEEKRNPWLLLERPIADPQAPIADPQAPVIAGLLDQNTALYSLHVGLGDTLSIEDGRSRPLQVKIVGLLKNSIFQGSLLIAEKATIERFPDVAGYRYFLIDAGGERANAGGERANAGGEKRSARSEGANAANERPDPVARVRAALEDRLGDYGFTAERSVDRLASLMAVQNTYLATFQTLGGLGLLLGAVGLAAVELRSVLERQAELALMRAVGFRRRRLAGLVLLEHLALLASGLTAGVCAAAVAVIPHVAIGDAQLPWLRLTTLLALVLAAGLVAGLVAVRAVLRTPLIAALRAE